MSQHLLSNIAQFLGLSENEIKVYEYLLNNKNINISNIAKISNLNRTQVYEAFDALSVFGLITKPAGRNKSITMMNPESILAGLKQKQLQAESYARQFQSILPDLQQSYALTNKIIPVRIVQGRTRFEDLFLEMYDTENKELLFIGNADEFYNFLDENYIDFAIKKRVKKGVLHRVLAYQPGVSLKRLQAFEQRDLRHVRYLPAEFSSLGYINIFGNKVVSWNSQLARAVIIQDSLIANFYKTMFEILWKFSESN